jgi:2-dehydro-3-deoxygluconokinase
MADRILFFGELLLRLSPPEKRMMVQARALDIHVGGAEANVAAALSALGHSSAMISRLPDNALGRLTLAEVRARGIDTAHVTHGAGRMGLYFLEQGQGARASAITYDRAGSAFAIADPAGFDFKAALAGARLLHLSGITPALGPDGTAAALRAAATAREMGIPVSFDGNFRAQLWAAWDSDPKSTLTELMGMATILFGNHRDIALVTGGTFSGDGPERRREAVDAAFAAFPSLEMIASTARHVVDADHHRISARVDRRDGHAQTDEIDVTGIVDRIGTGDGFAAGILDGWLRGADITEIAETGLALAVLKHSLPGDMTLFTRDDLAAFLSGGRDVRR